MSRNVCDGCGAPVPMGRILPVRRTPESRYYVVANGNVLHRDEFGNAASYYGRVVATRWTRCCGDARCAEYSDEVAS